MHSFLFFLVGWGGEGGGLTGFDRTARLVATVPGSAIPQRRKKVVFLMTLYLYEREEKKVSKRKKKLR